jgi:hypothetical protein
MGVGSFSAVYRRVNSPWVVKICSRPKDDGWFDYIHWASENSFLGGLAPIVNNIHIHSWGYVASMEYLDDMGKASAEVSEASYDLGMAMLGSISKNDTKILQLNKYCPDWQRYVDTWRKSPEVNNCYDGGGSNTRWRQSNNTIVMSDPVGYSWHAFYCTSAKKIKFSTAIHRNTP